MNDVTLWDRLPEEPSHWFSRFCAYLEQKPPRSVLRVYRTKGLIRHEKERTGAMNPTSIPASWRAAKARFRWEERAAVWDKAEEARVQLRVSEQQRAERECELVIAQRLRQKAFALLALPVVVEVVKRNRAGEAIAFLLVPEFRAFKAASDMFGQALRHARLALNMPLVVRQEVNERPVEAPLVGILSEDEPRGRLVTLTRHATEHTFLH